VARKKDSTGICFVGDGEYHKFVESQVSRDEIESQKGVIRRYPSGDVMSEHRGIHHFTIGQSRGLGMTHHEKLFVVKIDPVTKTVWVGDEKYLYNDEMRVRNVSWITKQKRLDEPLTIKIRSTHKGAVGKILKFNDQDNTYLVKFDEPQRAITPGQAAVFYHGNQLIGGGWIL